MENNYIQIYNGYLQHPNKYALTGIFVDKQYLIDNNMTPEQYRDKIINEYYGK